MRPRLRRLLLAPGRLGLRFALDCSRRFFGLRSVVAVSSVAHGRIEFVSRAIQARQFYGLSFRFQLLSTPCRQDAVTFNSWREAPPQRDFHPPMHALSQAHDCVRASAAFPQASAILSRYRATNLILFPETGETTRSIFPSLDKVFAVFFDGALVFYRSDEFDSAISPGFLSGFGDGEHAAISCAHASSTNVRLHLFNRRSHGGQ